MVTIYAIKCFINGKHYIGCTRGGAAKRWREHRCLLRAGKHSCKPLQDDWSEIGEAFFSLVACEQITGDESVERRREAELRWMGRFRTEGSLYNEHIQSFSPPEGAPAKAAAARVANGYRQSAESNEKRRLAQLGVPKGHGAKISATKRKRRDSLSTGETQASEAVDKEPPR